MAEAEILYGRACLPGGRRRDALADQARALFETELAERVPPLAGAAAAAFAGLAAERRRLGRPVAPVDALIAASARVAGAAAAPRDVADRGVRVVDPWEAA